MRRLPLLLALVVFAAPSFARASDPTYPVTSFLGQFNGDLASLQDADAGSYTFQAGWIDAINRLLTQEQLHAGDTPADKAQALYDSLIHMRPDPPYTHITEGGDPALSPDWNHDGVFGDAAQQSPNGVGDYDVDVDYVHDTAYFRYPCFTVRDNWALHYERADGSCGTKGTSASRRYGITHEVTVVNSRGITLDGTLWLPNDAFKAGACPAFGSKTYASAAAWSRCVRAASFSGKKFPGVVFNDGLASMQQYYYCYAQLLVSKGYIVLTYDPVGQGRSEGNFIDLLGMTLAQPSACQFGGACLDAQDMTRWFVGRSITPVADNGARFAPRKDPAKNAHDPILPALDTSRIVMTGHSMGALSTLSYMRALGEGKGYDGRALPWIKAASPMSGAAETHASVPLQLLTADYDGSPATPGLLGIELAGGGEGIGPHSMKQMYDALRTTKERGPLSFLVVESSQHFDFADQPPVAANQIARGLAGWYMVNWFDCYAKGRSAACARAGKAMPNLSKSFASEHDLDGPIGPSPSRCMTVPTEANLNQSPDEFLAAMGGAPVYSCKP